MNLRRKRHDQKMTQEELAERAGLSARYVGAIERGDVSASVTVLGQIAGGTSRCFLGSSALSIARSAAINAAGLLLA